MEVTTTSGAESVTPSAEAVAVTETPVIEAETQTLTAEPVDNVASGESEEPTGLQPHQTTLEERVQQLVEKRLAAMESKLAKEEPPPYAPPEAIERLQGMITGAVLRENQILSELNLEEDPHEQAKLATELRQIRKWLPQAEDALEKDFALRQEWEKKQYQTAEQQAFIDRQNARMNEAQELYRREMNIPENIWTAARDFFQNERQAHPLLNQQYLQRWERGGEIAALEFAKEYCEKNMGKRQEQAIQQREDAKNLIAGGKTSTGEVVGNPELEALREKASSGHPEDMANYSAAKAKARQAVA